MILYHATRKSRGDKILSDGLIKCHTLREYTSEGTIEVNGRTAKTATTDGFVYLASNPIIAITLVNASTYLARENQMYLLEVNIDDKLLMPDKDQLNLVSVRRNCSYPDNITATESIQTCCCAAYPYDVDIKKSNARYLVLPSTSYDGKTVTKKQAEQTCSMIQVTTPFFDGIGMLEENPGYSAAMNFINAGDWIKVV